MINFFHKLFNPHCPDCRQEKEESKICPTCDTLRQLLETEKFENKQLLDRLLFVPSNPPVEQNGEPIPIRQNPISLRVRREMLEKEDRAKAQVLQRKEKELTYSTEDLEKVLGIEDEDARKIVKAI